MKAVLKPAGLTVVVLFALASAGASGTVEAGVEAVQQEGGSQEPLVLGPVTPHVMNADLRTMPPVGALLRGGPVRVVERRRPDVTLPDRIAEQIDESGIQRGVPGPVAPLAIINFAGKGATGYVPPDTIGDVGPNHYIQMVNTVFTIYDKTGAVLAGPSNINSLWAGFGGPCQTENAGDPVVLYDRLANRWVMSQFGAWGGATENECIAISQTGDPVSGGWNLYDFTTPVFPDYPKLGVWPDAYYMGANQGTNVGAYAFDRNRMLAGLSATAIVMSTPAVSLHSMMVPSDLDGGMPPPVGTPNFYQRFIDNVLGGGSDRIEIWEFHVDFATPANSTFTGPTSLGTASFDSLCGWSFDCIVQPDTSQKVDAITEWPMWRGAYRNFRSHETLLGNHAVNVGGDQAGIRWYELRRNPGGAWTLYQESTFAPDASSRWMGSIAMDGSGNIALGYSVSSASVYPSIRYTARLASDPLNQMMNEQSLVVGGGSQTLFNRWGDYSSLNIDPRDDCTFWYTNEYYATSSPAGWATRIGAFRLPSCKAREMIFIADEEESREDGR